MEYENPEGAEEVVPGLPYEASSPPSIDTIRSILLRSFEIGRIVLSDHFCDRGEEREFSTLDAQEIVEAGRIVNGPLYRTEHHSWKYEFAGEIDGKSWLLALALDCAADVLVNPRVVLITAHRLRRKRRDQGRLLKIDRTKGGSTTMKCQECNKAMRRERRDYRYSECGLGNVTLKNIVVYACDCGATAPEIPNLSALHRNIMMDLLKKESLLCAEEIKFLRKMARLKSKELASLMGFSTVHLSRLEHGARKISASGDRVIRLICYGGLLERLVNAEGDLKTSIAEAAKLAPGLNIRTLFENIEGTDNGPEPVVIDPADLGEQQYEMVH